MKYLFSFLLLFLVSFTAKSQTTNGLVTDYKNMPLPGVNVIQKASGKSTTTDFDGKFSIESAVGDFLEFSYIGFETISIKASTGTMKIVMVEKTNNLNEVVVIGYGTKKLGSITGSVAQIKANDIIKTAAQSPIQSIQGRAAGVNIVTNDEPGANPSIRIRGLGTILGGRDPLYIVDGVETGINGLSPNEIATIDILKDASSLAIYGQKGSNGVVIITTKKGKLGRVKVSYDSYYGQKFIQKKVKMADSYRFAYYNNVAAGSSSYYSFDQPYNTDWLEEITDTGEVINNHISISGANENASYYLGATNYKEKGILTGTEYERNNVNSRNEFKLLDNKLKIAQNINLTVANNVTKPTSAFTNAYKQSPIVPVYFDNGRWGVPLRNPATGLIDINGSDRFNNVANPVAQLFYTNNQNKDVTIVGSISAELKLTKELTYTSNFGATYNTYKGFSFTPNDQIYLSQNATSTIDDYVASFGNSEVIYNTLEQKRSNYYEYNWDNYITFKKTFGNHNVNAVLGMSRTTTKNFENLNGVRYNVPVASNYWSLDLSSYNTATAPGSVITNHRDTPVVSLAYFGRFEYDFKGKYLITASVRREGTSSFQEVQKWGVFPAVSAGWVMSEEKFLQNVKFLNYLKIRAGYGEVGNARALNSLNIPIFSAGANYAFGDNQSIFPGSTQPYDVDPNLTWETMGEFDLGIDFKVLNNKLSGTIDLYDRRSKDVILPVTLPPVLSQGNVTVNTGDVTNKGVELSLRWDKKINDNWSYFISGNYSYNKNELVKADNSYFANLIGGGLGNGQWTKQVLVGEALGSFYVYQVTGKNSDGNFTYSSERVVAGSYLPTYTYGLSFGINYKKFDFSVDTYGVGGNKVYNGKKAQRFGGENIEHGYLNSFWSPSTPNGVNPAPYNEVPVASTYFVEDGSYFRINNITLGYTLPNFFEKIDKVRIYATAINPLLFTKYSGYSPEVVGGDNANPLGGAGIELDAYPTNKTFLFGLNVSF
ncbi:SusC/RagA family TonB-linked outer membrane protein [Flavobacterium paronense]|uniref:SusC/RagA family TonB-linked outer membrane protein n=1 Tax=Flavobacterium paronense TaxID=1392775 RepID=A0ABV5GH08_9FLAO|nr:SusC/RagA family TonB-linked outer membrane protein [Flavobacterium paronense]MDN3677298.1 SusC/RagA family TonB-linked outer membrane protein [Flavobacterium paronense]